MPVLPAEVPTGLVTGQYYFVSADMVDADTNPDLTVVTGTVRFTCSAPELRMAGKKATIIPMQFLAKFNGAGQLVTVGDATPGIKLPGISPEVTPTGFTWWVDFDLTDADGYKLPLDGFPIKVTAGQTLDLSEDKAVEASPGYFITRGPQGDKGDSIKGDTGLTPNLTIGTVEAGQANPADGSWVAGLIRGSADVTSALRDTFPSTMKGDAGVGWNYTTLSDGVNLNNVLTPGVYRQNSGALAQTALNYPKSGDAGVLTVTTWGAADQVIQRWTPYPTGTPQRIPGEYLRGSRGGAFTPWQFISPQRVDTTAGRAIYTWDDTTSREQLIYGDTGTRDVKTLITNGWVIENVKLRRVGNLVIFSAYNVNPAAKTAEAALILPAGFHPSPGYMGNMSFPVRASTPSGLGWITIYSSNKAVVPEQSVASLTGTIFSIQWHTDDPWPTSLPGTAAGTIPNL